MSFAAVSANPRNLTSDVISGPPWHALERPRAADSLDDIDAIIAKLSAEPNAFRQGQLLRALDAATGDRAATEALSRNETPRLQLADASTFNWGQLGIKSATAQGLGYPSAQKPVPTPADPSGSRSAIKGLGWVGGGLILSEAITKIVGPAPVLKSETAIGQNGDLAIVTYGKAYTGTEAKPGAAYFTRGIGGARLDVPVQMSVKGFTFDAQLLERALGHQLPPELQTQTQKETGATIQTGTPTVSLPRAGAELKSNEQNIRQCKDVGYWGPENGYAAREKTQPNANRYQDFINGNPGQNFYVTSAISKITVAFDGCKDTNTGAVLLEAKAKHPDIMGKEYYTGKDAHRAQAKRQQDAAVEHGVKMEWNVQTARDTAEFIKIFAPYRNINMIPVIHKPMPTGPQ